MGLGMRSGVLPEAVPQYVMRRAGGGEVSVLLGRRSHARERGTDAQCVARTGRAMEACVQCFLHLWLLLSLNVRLVSEADPSVCRF